MLAPNTRRIFFQRANLRPKYREWSPPANLVGLGGGAVNLPTGAGSRGLLDTIDVDHALTYLGRPAAVSSPYPAAKSSTNSAAGTISLMNGGGDSLISELFAPEMLADGAVCPVFSPDCQCVPSFYCRLNIEYRSPIYGDSIPSWTEISYFGSSAYSRWRLHPCSSCQYGSRPDIYWTGAYRVL